MPRADEIKDQILTKEGITVIIADSVGNRVNANKIIPSNGYHIRTDDAVTVSVWENQFAMLFPNFTANVVDSEGNEINGNTRLERLRCN